MKYELQKGTLGLIHWLKSTAKNQTLLSASTDLKDVAEVCWAFTLPLAEIEKMTRQKIEAELKKFMAELEADEWRELQAHAERELNKFFATDVRPKKPITRQPARQTKKRGR